MAEPIYERQNHYINGAWVPSTDAPKSLDVTDSNTGKVISRVPAGSAEDTNLAVKAAKGALDAWAATPAGTRKDYLHKVLLSFQAKKPKGVEMLMKELGCTKAFAENVQVMFVDWHFGALLAAADNIKWSEPAGNCVVVKEPVGVVGCITPWNYPLNQICLKIGAALMAGCTVVLKPSEVTPSIAYLFAEAVDEAGIPAGVFNMVMGLGPVCGEALAEHPDVDMISFTGSTRAARRISEVASQTLKILKTELGGKSAALVLDDADLQSTVPAFVQQLMNNTGQSCNALSRMLVPRSRYEETLGMCQTIAEGVKVGRSDDPDSAIGPLVSDVQWERVQSYLRKGTEEGARLVTGGPGKPPGLEDGYFVKPTVFADVDNKMTIAQEEIFGPVLSVIPYDTEEEGIKLANDTIYGLNNAVASSNPERALRVASQLRSGMVMVNGVSMDFNAPFGGYKQSGNAREWGLYGVDDFLITKTINVPPALYYKQSASSTAAPGVVQKVKALVMKPEVAYSVALLAALWGLSLSRRRQ